MTSTQITIPHAFLLLPWLQVTHNRNTDFLEKCALYHNRKVQSQVPYQDTKTCTSMKDLIAHG